MRLVEFSLHGIIELSSLYRNRGTLDHLSGAKRKLRGAAYTIFAMKRMKENPDTLMNGVKPIKMIYTCSLRQVTDYSLHGISIVKIIKGSSLKVSQCAIIATITGHC